MMINCWISGAPNCWTNQTMGLVSADESAIRAFATCPCKRWAAEKEGNSEREARGGIRGAQRLGIETIHQ